MKVRDHTFDVRGLKIHYAEWGDRTDVLLVLVHGFLDHARSWDPFIEVLQRVSSRPLWIVAPDCRGHGDSGWVGAGGYYHFPDYVLDLDCLIQILGVPSVHLMGHSMGGSISFQYSGTFPDRVKKLILVEGLGPPGLDFATAPLKMEKWLADMKTWKGKRTSEYSSVQSAAVRLRRENPRLSPELALSLAGHGTKRNGSGKWVWKFDPLHRTTCPQPFYVGHATEFLRRIQCPVLIIWGERGYRSLRADADRRLAALARRSTVEIPEAGHMVHHDDPEGLARAATEFLNQE